MDGSYLTVYDWKDMDVDFSEQWNIGGYDKDKAKAKKLKKYLESRPKKRRPPGFISARPPIDPYEPRDPLDW